MKNTVSTGTCRLCGFKGGREETAAHFMSAHGTDEAATQPCAVIEVTGAEDPSYWLLLDVPMSSHFSVLDKFLREIWLECCGHDSYFTDEEGNIINKSLRIEGGFSFPGLMYEYDTGSPTDLALRFIGTSQRVYRSKAVRLLARNDPFTYVCEDCGERAELTGEIWRPQYRRCFLCPECAEKRDDAEALLPVVNSPRMGVCGYTGLLDRYDNTSGFQPSENRPRRHVPKAYIWDLDGTLLNSYGVIVETLYRMTQEFGVPERKEDIHSFIIASTVGRYFAVLHEKTGLAVETIHWRYSEISSSLQGMITVMPGAIDLLSALSMRGDRHFVYTHRGKTSYELLFKLGISRYMEDIVTEADGFAQKPAPDAVNYLVEKYGLDRQHTYYVGDRNIDTGCARNAGIKGILYLNSESPCLPDGSADYTVNSLEEIEQIESDL